MERYPMGAEDWRRALSFIDAITDNDTEMRLRALVYHHDDPKGMALTLVGALTTLTEAVADAALEREEDEDGGRD